jgi:hypothetical protein
MKKRLFLFLIIGFNLATSCKQPSDTQPTETEDMKNLDQRRREMGMSPIEMYKRLMLRNL